MLVRTETETMCVMSGVGACEAMMGVGRVRMGGVGGHHGVMPHKSFMVR